MSRPIVVIPCCTKQIDGYTFDAVNRQYSMAVAEAAECQPLLIPLERALVDIGAILDIADGILLSGSPSNIEPRHYSDEAPLTARQARSGAGCVDLASDQDGDMPRRCRCSPSAAASRS